MKTKNLLCSDMILFHQSTQGGNLCSIQMTHVYAENLLFVWAYVKALVLFGTINIF